MRQKALDFDRIYIRVSIHASVKDATKVCVYRFRQIGFNPRICKRCDNGYGSHNYIIGVSIHASVKDATIANYYSV